MPLLMALRIPVHFLRLFLGIGTGAKTGITQKTVFLGRGSGIDAMLLFKGFYGSAH